MPTKDSGKSFLKALGQAIRSERERQDVSQEALALKVQVDRTYISGVERGVRNPTVRMLRQLADGLGVRASDLIRAAEGGR